MRILKFDTFHPDEFLLAKQKEWKNEISHLTRKEYLNKVLALRSNFSDFYTNGWQKLGWEAEEFIANDIVYFNKVAEEILGSKLMAWANKQMNRCIGKIKPDISGTMYWKNEVITAYINYFKPDVIFVRDPIPEIPNNFWHRFSDQALLVSRLAFYVPRHWHHTDWDLIYTSTREYLDFFTLNKVPTRINSNGFDPRILEELKDKSQCYDVSFVGALCPVVFCTRTQLMTYIANNLNFSWWGCGIEKIEKNSPLAKKWRGYTTGLEMYQIYHDSRIVINDYVDMSKNQALNQRIFEVMGVGTLLLTRYAPNLSKTFPKDCLVTFLDEKDCVDKACYFLKNEAERQEIAKAGQKFILENYSYEDLMKTLSEDMKDAYWKKFNKHLS